MIQKIKELYKTRLAQFGCGASAKGLRLILTHGKKNLSWVSQITFGPMAARPAKRQRFSSGFWLKDRCLLYGFLVSLPLTRTGTRNTWSEFRGITPNTAPCA